MALTCFKCGLPVVNDTCPCSPMSEDEYAETRDRVALAILNAHRRFCGYEDVADIERVEGGRLYRILAKAAMQELGFGRVE